MATPGSRSQAVRMTIEELGLSGIPNLSSQYKKGEMQPVSASVERPDPYHNLKVSLIRYDITKLRVDAIVNAANKELSGGSGVNRAIRTAAGDQMRLACELQGGCAIGSAVVTEAYDLPCRRVIHAVGPRYGRDQNARELLQTCYRSALELTASQKCKSVAFSCISTGVYGYPTEEAAIIAIETVRGFLDSRMSERLVRVIFCCFEEKDEQAYRKYLPYFPPTEQERAEGRPQGDIRDEMFTVTAPRPQTPRGSNTLRSARSWDGQSTPRTLRDGRSGSTPRESRAGGGSSSYEQRPSDPSRRYAQQGSYEGSARSEPSRPPAGPSRSSQPRPDPSNRSRLPKSPRRQDPAPPYAAVESSGRFDRASVPMQSAFDPFAGYTPQRASGPPRPSGGGPPRQSSGSRRPTQTPITGGIPETSENSGSGTPKRDGASPDRNLAASQPEITSAAELASGGAGIEVGRSAAARPRRDEASGPEAVRSRRRFSFCGDGGCMKDPVNYALSTEKVGLAPSQQQQRKSEKKPKPKPKPKRKGFYFQGF